MKKCVVMFILFIAALVITIYIEPEANNSKGQDLAVHEKVHIKDLVEQKAVSTDFEQQQVSSYVHVVDN
ncbi:hypothetical protein [Kriegella aquimaris]|uniref:Uncharacterized protein n=1 Tax=Kriegella aquimaris TaxID=192904 RepID=A0A1G9QTP6_9FLAO|nr:hypothetical protein [Kriegella aquimaris]SDM14343.1 hypothetical protein SAMN04488514_105201 [Kriegella aquimaris]